MELKKGDISFRAVEPEDVKILLKWENNVDTWHLSNTLIPFSRFDIEQYVMNAGKDIFTTKQLRLMINLSDKDQQITVGCIDLFEFDPIHKRAGIGILIDEEYRKRGIAIKSVDLLIDYAFNTLNLHQLFCNIEEDNKHSLSLFQHQGFEIAGLKKDWNYKSGYWVGEYLLQLFNDK